MKVLRKDFFSCLQGNKVFPNFVSLNQSQIRGMDAILHAWERSSYTDIRWLAYCLATAYHETAGHMYPIEEYGKGANRRYGKKLKYDGTPYSKPDKLYYGRGLVQLTFWDNYERIGKLLDIPLLSTPEIALDDNIASEILIQGMVKGWFTGRSLSQYFSTHREDPLHARAIINGSDRASLIESYYRAFKTCLNED